MYSKLLLFSSVLIVCSTICFAAGPDETVWLSSLDLSKMSVGWGEAVADKSIEKKPLRLGGKTFEKGVGSHADSIMYVKLNKSARRFKALVGVDDETEGKGTVCFRIYGDSSRLWQSGTMKGGDKPKAIDLETSGVETLILVATSAGDNVDYDHADWADARFEGVTKPIKAIDQPVEKAVMLTPKPKPAPHINGPKVFGTRPGRPFLYRIPATGVRPMTFSADNLPDGLTINTRTGIIRGRSPQKKGTYLITLGAKNSRGTDRREFTLVAGDTLALTPPMGWNDWYTHYHRIRDEDVRQAADQMIATGMADHGYMYVNIDDCWSKRNGDTPYRNDDGTILPNKKFPDMKALTEYIHQKGLRAGIYTSPGPWNCAGYTGSHGHEKQDAETFARWGFDFLKYDWCSYGRIEKGRDHEDYVKPYKKMGGILKELDRDIVYNLCQYGMDNVWEWGAEVGGNCWRTTGDLGLMSSFLQVGLSNARHWEHAEPGHWNDPDYILIGWVGSAHKQAEAEPVDLTPNQQYQYMSMWSLMAAPLIFSGHMGKLDEFTLNILCNHEVIEVDQDPLGTQGRIVKRDDDHFVMVRPLEDGSKAVGLFNTSVLPLTLSAAWSDLGISGAQKVRDLWRQKELGVFNDIFKCKVDRHGVMMVKLRPANKD